MPTPRDTSRISAEAVRAQTARYRRLVEQDPEKYGALRLLLGDDAPAPRKPVPGLPDPTTSPLPPAEDAP